MKIRLQLSCVILLSILYFSCVETEDGCLDILSSNFDFHAVSSCDSCCVYPSTRFNFGLIHGDNPFNLNRDTLVLPSLDSFSITKLEILFSDFEFFGDKDTYEVRDTIRNSGFTIKNDFAFFKTASSRIIGRTRFQDTIRTLKFRVGFDQSEISQLQPFSELDQNIHLDEVLDSLYLIDEDRYLASRINIRLKDSLRTIVINDPIENNVVSFDVNIPIQGGVEWEIVCNLNIETLVKELSATQTNEEITEIFRTTISSSLTLE